MKILGDLKVRGYNLQRIAPAVVVICLILNGVWFFEEMIFDRPYSWGHYRQQVIADLKSKPGKDLIFVHRGKDHNVHQGWIYNPADIDNAEVLFARDLGPEKNRKLGEYFKDHNVWGLQPDLPPPRNSSCL